MIFSAAVFCLIGWFFWNSKGNVYAGDMILPFTIPLICMGLAFLLFCCSFNTHIKLHGTLWGAFTGGSILMLGLLFCLAMRFDIIMNDGTAFWVFIILPNFWMGLIMLIGGACIGAFMSPNSKSVIT